MAPKALAPGVRFHPTDVELVKYYLQKKVTGKRIRFDVISEVDVYKFSPSDLPDKSQLKSMDLEWYFFCPRERKFVNGARLNRATENGYWKTTGRDRVIEYNDKTVGMIKTLIFYEGRAPKGNRTDWVMHEYRLKNEDLAKSGINQDAYVICKIFLKSGPGPRPTQHLFKEDDWSDDNDDDTTVNTYSTEASFLIAMNMNNPSCSSVTNLGMPDSITMDAYIDASPIESISFLREGDSESISLIEFPSSPKELPSMMTKQKDAPISDLTQVPNSHRCGNQNVYNLQCRNVMHDNSCLLCDGLPNNAAFSTWEMLVEGCMLPSQSDGTAVGNLNDANDSEFVQSAGLDCDDPSKLLDNFYAVEVQSGYEETLMQLGNDNHNHPGSVQSIPLCCADPYKDLDYFYAMGIQSEYDESFIELDDLITPLDNELHWSHPIPADGLSNEVDQHGCKVIPSLSVDDYIDSGSYETGPAESLLLPQSSLGFIGCTDTPQKDNAHDYGSSTSCTAKSKQWKGKNPWTNG